MCEYNDRLLAVAWWVILNSPDLLWNLSTDFQLEYQVYHAYFL